MLSLAHIHPPCTLCDLQRVYSPSGTVYASDSSLFKDAFFGRDALEVAEDLLEVYSQIAHSVILSLARLQGIAVNRQSEEEPGKIHHEYRSLYVDGRKISEASQNILRDLSQQWGGTDTEVLYYGTIDATPLYVRLIADYCQAYGIDLLDLSYQSRSGQTCTIRDSMLRALQWIVAKITASDLHLLEFLRTNEHGHAYQDWKDGNLHSHIHQNGDSLNFLAPIASIGVQGLAYDALVKSAQLFYRDKPKEASTWTALAKQLQEETLRHFWMPKEQFFATAIDRDLSGHPRQAQTITSDPGTLLATSLFDTLQEGEKRIYIAAIAKRIYSQEFITDVGIRCRSLLHKDLVTHADSQGAWTVWPKETYDIAKGFRRQGFNSLAEQLEIRTLNAVNIAASHVEFFFVHPDGRVCYDPKGERSYSTPVEKIPARGIPEETQAWTVSAVVAIQHAMKKMQNLPQSRDHWQTPLEELLLKQVPHMTLLTAPEEIQSAFPTNYSLVIDITDRSRETARMHAQTSATEADTHL